MFILGGMRQEVYIPFAWRKGTDNTANILDHFIGISSFFKKPCRPQPAWLADYLDSSQAAASARARPARWRRVRASWRKTRLKTTVMAG